MLTRNQCQLIYWITERESIRLNKLAGDPAPWTCNKVMQETYFCNVNREDDKVTKWIREHWLYDTEMHKWDYTFAMIVARIFNLPSTLEAISQPGDLDWLWDAEDILTKRKEQGLQIWNGAYIISTNGKKMDKLTYCFQLFEKMLDSPVIDSEFTTLQAEHEALMKVEGLASFLAAQVVADLKNTKDHPLSTAPDWWTFSAPGPGSLRGLSWFWDTKVTKKNYHEAIKEAFDIIVFDLPASVIDKMCMQNFQNCFCEYDKFMRVTTGTGKSKRKYKGV